MEVDILEPVVQVFRKIRGFWLSLRSGLGGKLAPGRAVLRELLVAREREIVARERFRQGIQYSADDSNRDAKIFEAGRIVAAALGHLRGASFYWRRILISCKIDYDMWYALEDAIDNARAADNDIRRSIRNGKYDQIEDSFEYAMTYKHEAIKQIKSYLSKLKGAGSALERGQN